MPTTARHITLANLKKDVKSAANKEKAALLQRFFKTGPGEYAEGDVFAGLMVPVSRKIARKYAELPLSEIKRLLASEIHEERLIALLILVARFTDGDEPTRKKIFDLYLRSTERVNNWDLVDLSAPKIVGARLLHRDAGILKKLARSKNVWERRIAIVSTMHFIARGRFAETLEIAEMLLRDRHDLIHKATGWMLREVGKKSAPTLRRFLDTHAAGMPATMLRYAIERFPDSRRRAYLKKRRG